MLPIVFALGLLHTSLLELQASLPVESPVMPQVEINATSTIQVPNLSTLSRIERRDTIWKVVSQLSKEYKVDSEKIMKTLECENKSFDPLLQSGHVKNGKREESYGLAQFHIPAGNKTKDGIVITKEMAQDPTIALETMVYYFSIGKARLWSCYTSLYPAQGNTK
jgi:hypothetical protein